MLCRAYVPLAKVIRPGSRDIKAKSCSTDSLQRIFKAGELTSGELAIGRNDWSPLRHSAEGVRVYRSLFTTDTLSGSGRFHKI